MAETSKNTNYRYFLYSQAHVNEQNEILGRVGKEFVCGTVILGNKKQDYSFMSTKPNLGSRYPDCKIVAEGLINSIHYTVPTNRPKGSN